MHSLRRGNCFKSFSIFSFCSHLVQLSGTVWAILVDSHLRNIPMKLFQNLSADLAEEYVKSSFLFIALAAILFHVAESFKQFWWRVTQETFLYNYFKICLQVQEKKSFKGFFYFKLRRLSWSTERNGFSKFGRGSSKEPFYTIISKSMYWLRRNCSFKVFLFLAVAAILFNGAEWFEQFL